MQASELQMIRALQAEHEGDPTHEDKNERIRMARDPDERQKLVAAVKTLLSESKAEETLADFIADKLIRLKFAAAEDGEALNHKFVADMEGAWFPWPTYTWPCPKVTPRACDGAGKHRGPLRGRQDETNHARVRSTSPLKARRAPHARKHTNARARYTSVDAETDRRDER